MNTVDLCWTSVILNGSNPASFCFFSFFPHCKAKYSTTVTLNYVRLDEVLGTRTRGGRMEGANESTEPCWHPKTRECFLTSISRTVLNRLEHSWLWSNGQIIWVQCPLVANLINVVRYLGSYSALVIFLSVCLDHVED